MPDMEANANEASQKRRNALSRQSREDIFCCCCGWVCAKREKEHATLATIIFHRSVRWAW